MFLYLYILVSYDSLQDKKTEAMVLVGPKAGISLVTNIRFYTVSIVVSLLYMLDNFLCFCFCPLTFFKITFFKIFFQEHYQSVSSSDNHCKQFTPRPGSTERWS